MITYKDSNDGTISVYLDGKLVGKIHEHARGFRYYPTGAKTGGDIYKTIAEVKRSLESE